MSSPRTNAYEFPMFGKYYDSTNTSGGVTIGTAKDQRQLYAVTDLTIASASFENNVDPDGIISSVTIPAGVLLPGVILTLEITSGIGFVLSQSTIK